MSHPHEQPNSTPASDPTATTSPSSPPEAESLLAAAEAYARAELGGDTSGHDWWHVQRVADMARRLAADEGADPFLCVLAALLHDVADEKLNPSKEAGMAKVASWLEARELADGDREHVLEIIGTMSYNGGANPPMRTLEGRVVQDADRLDAIGAIAVARTFVYAGHVGHPIHDPELPPRDSLVLTSEEYRRGKSTAINHFHEKLLKLKDRLNTPAAKSIAEQRHAFMRSYLEQFQQEWDGER
ncbi:HD domain-containing protein [Paenibacillus albicereus]|uniref:HD domain-containing protein n=1 Tax=Paenibacillus albicereus TaxID=2726185 RepID=A0A6H2H2Y1_9BACL|nr:HD domain-containing protein [Paenibacillus albicereus]QJC54022.1 HD domain-containing protein [Paenibacillus albicereus]